MTKPLTHLSMQIGNCKLRTCDINGKQLLEHCNMEISALGVGEDNTEEWVQVAYWDKEYPGLHLVFIEDRPIIKCDPEVFWKLASRGYKHLAAYYAGKEFLQNW